jgi:hypothetical protein
MILQASASQIIGAKVHTAHAMLTIRREVFLKKKT